MQVFDASSIIHAWDHYPAAQFPPLWRWLERQMAEKKLGICEVALSEVRRRSPDCYTRLRAANITCFPITDETVKKAAQVKALLGIAGEKYNPAGVGENDLLIVASACVNRQRLVSNENRQWDLPLNKAKYKIPLVCSLPQVGVTCIDFLALIQNSGEVFEGGR